MKGKAFLSSEKRAIDDNKAKSNFRRWGCLLASPGVRRGNRGRFAKISNRPISMFRRSSKLILKYVGTVLILSDSCDFERHRAIFDFAVDNPREGVKPS